MRVRARKIIEVEINAKVGKRDTADNDVVVRFHFESPAIPFLAKDDPLDDPLPFPRQNREKRHDTVHRRCTISV